jgi:hypothetical protein
VAGNWQRRRFPGVMLPSGGGPRKTHVVARGYRFTRISPESCYQFRHMKIRSLQLVLCALTGLTLGAHAETTTPKAAPASAVPAHDYVRFVGDDLRGRLETVVVSMQNDAGVKVELVGAVHIADPSYYKTLSQLFTSYEELLFELVDGQTLKDEAEGKPHGKGAKPKAGKPGTTPPATPPTPAFQPPKEKAPAKDEDEGKSKGGPGFAILRMMMQGMGSYLKLEYQTDGIDYHTKNFVHADVSMAEFLRLQEEKGESFFTLFQKAVQSQIGKKGAKDQEPTGAQLLLALLGDSSGVKISMARMLGQAEEVGEAAGMGADSVILGERNRVALEVFDREVKAGRKNLGIFYGAAHLGDMESRLEKRGFKRTGERWMTAWDIKPLADEKKQAAPEAPKP